MTVLNNILLLTTLSHLFTALASSSFKCFDTHHAMSIFITEALYLATYVQLF